MKKLLQKIPSRGFYLLAIAFLCTFAITLRSNAAGEGYVIIVNAKNPVSASNIKMSHVRNIFLLNKTKWKGGKRAKPIFPAEGSGAYDVLLKKVLKMNQAKLNRHWLQIKQRTGTSPPSNAAGSMAMIKSVSNSAGGIAIVKSGIELPKEVKVVVNVK